MAIQIGAKPDAGFDDPLGMLKDCHRRIENFLRILCTVAQQSAGRALTHEEKEAIHAALHYFRVGGARHNADEEQSLFPRMCAEAAPVSELEEIAALENEHRIAGELHIEVEHLYKTWIEQGSLAASQAEQLHTATRRLETIYAKHIQIEETVVFPRAAAALAPQTIATIGEEFKARRQ